MGVGGSGFQKRRRSCGPAGVRGGNGCHGMRLPRMDETSSQNQLAGSGSPAGVANRQNLEEPNQRIQYSIPGILHFIQHEWARFEMERSQWELERAELQAKIAFLNGERKGQENLKNDLVRRIKMLEYALKQERAKYHKLKYGTELVQGDMNPPVEEGGEEVRVDPDAILSTNTNVSWKQSRHLLRQYLQEIGYTDTIIDLRSNRVRSLLGISSGENEENHNSTPAVNGSDTTKRQPDPNRWNPQSTLEAQIRDAEKAVIDNFAFLRSEGMEMDEDDDEEDAEEEEDVHGLKSPKAVKTLDVDDVDGEPVELDHEFPFLPDVEDNPPPLRFGSFHLSDDTAPCEQGWEGVVKSAYRSFCQCSHSPGSPRFIVSPAAGVMGFGPARRGYGGPGGEDDALVEGLGELAQLTVNNEADASYDEPTLITASEDATLKLWNLQKTVPAKKSASLDVEPVYTFRGHLGPVLCLAMSGDGEKCYSGGIDGTIRIWNIPSSNIDPYDSYEPSVVAGSLSGHTDAVWGLTFNPQRQHLISCAADSTVRLWSADTRSPLLYTYSVERGRPPFSGWGNTDTKGCEPLWQNPEMEMKVKLAQGCSGQPELS
ncbi:Striatin-3 [Portunus trituberculatus]|uniref:Striatin-3 n=1 Tax=Portunus trituberculatus TaxID=210409 RepID=A0A5B7DS31_PORTR|nr:Striatin-3 [Portunus trituberculatus]